MFLLQRVSLPNPRHHCPRHLEVVGPSPQAERLEVTSRPSAAWEAEGRPGLNTGVRLPSATGVLVLSWYPPGLADNNGEPSKSLVLFILDAVHRHAIKVGLLLPVAGSD